MSWTRRTVLRIGAGAVAAAGLAACGRGGRGEPAGEVVRVGSAARQRFELTRPPAGDRPPVVVVIHGGFWRNQYDLDLMRPLVPSLVARGWAVANLEYRSLGDPGGGWPGTFEDVATAIDHLAELDDLDLDRVVTIGHSAGGHLAVWAAARSRLPAGTAGSSPEVVVRGAVAQAGLLDLARAADDRLGGGAASTLLGGGPSAVPEVYAAASPIQLLPLGVPVELVHGAGDGIVPMDQSEGYLAAAEAAGDQVALTRVPGDHFALIDPGSEAWAESLAAVDRLLSRPG